MQAPFLFSLIVKATVLIVGAWACARILSRASAAARSAAWASGLILSAALPAAMLIAPYAQASTIEMTVNGLVCGFCAQGIEKTLRKNPATADVLVSLENRLVAVTTQPGSDISDDTLRNALKDAGYDVKAIARTERSLDTLRQSLKEKR